MSKKPSKAILPNKLFLDFFDEVAKDDFMGSRLFKKFAHRHTNFTRNLPSFTTITAKDIRFVDGAMEKICRSMTDMVCKNPSYQIAAHKIARSLLTALSKRTGGDWARFVTIHTDVMQVCLVAKLYSVAVALADVPLVGVSLRRYAPSGVGGVSLSNQAVPSDSMEPVDEATNKILSLDLQRYYYYAGIAYCGVKRFHDAKDAFAQCLALPSRVFGSVHGVAQTKFAMVSLICQRSISRLPRYTSTVVGRSVVSEIYKDLESAFQNQENSGDLMSLSSNATFAADDNAGLMEHVLTAYAKNKVVKLTGTYVTLGLGEIAKAANFGNAQNAEMQLLKLINDGEVKARVDQRAGSVRFLSDSEASGDDPNAIVYKIEAEIDRVAEVAAKLREFDTKLSTSKPFISRLVLRQTGSFGSGAGDAFM